MKAVSFQNYGPPEVLHLVELPVPEPDKDEVRIRVKASTVNSGDWRVRKADPWLVRLFFGLVRPRLNVPGTVFSGSIDKGGSRTGRFQPGDGVFGISDQKMGAHAEYLTMPEASTLAAKPAELSHSQAAALVFGGHTALHFLRQAGELKDKTILIYGASGSVGSSAVQLATYHGARVTAVCSEKNVSLMRSLGVEEVIDYTQTDLSKLDTRYDLVFETVNKLSVRAAARLVKPGGTLILSAAMIGGMLQSSLISSIKGIRVITGVVKTSANDLEFLARLAVEGKLNPVIDRTYSMDQIAEAHRYVEAGHKSGNVVLSIAD